MVVWVHIIAQLILFINYLPIIDYSDIGYQNVSDTYLRPLSIVFNSLYGFVHIERIIVSCMNHLIGCSLHLEDNFTGFNSPSNVFILIEFHIWNSFWFHVYLHIHSDISNIPFFPPEFSNKSDAGHSNTKLQPNGIIFFFFWALLPLFAALGHLYFLILKQPVATDSLSRSLYPIVLWYHSWGLGVWWERVNELSVSVYLQCMLLM